jgi:hypothetical protein
MKVCVIKITVRRVSPMVWRRLRIAADTPLATLHFIFQILQGWGDGYLHQFHIYGKDYGISDGGGIAPHTDLYILIDSTGLKVYGAGQWREEKHGVRARRDWRKLHLAVDTDNFSIVAHTLTDSQTDDPSQVGPLLNQTDSALLVLC